MIIIICVAVSVGGKPPGITGDGLNFASASKTFSPTNVRRQLRSCRRSCLVDPPAPPISMLIYVSALGRVTLSQN